MESSVVTTFLLVFCLVRGFSARETILIDEKVAINNGEIERENVSREIETRKSFFVKIETFKDNGTVIGTLRNCGVPGKKLKDIRTFRYCLNELAHDRDKDPFIRVNLIRSSNEEYIEETTANLESGKIKLLREASKKEELLTCEIRLDPDCNATENKENSNYPKWLLRSGAIDDYDSDTNFTRDKEFVRKTNTNGYETIDFEVDAFTFGIYVLAEGNFSNIVIGIPNDGKWETGDPRTTSLSMRQRENPEGVEIMALNAPPGGWRLKLYGEGASNYSYLVHVRKIREERDGNDRIDVATMMADGESIFQENDTNFGGNHQRHLKSLDNVEVFDELVQGNRRIFIEDDSSENPGARNKRNKAEFGMEDSLDRFPSIRSEEITEIQSRMSNDPSKKIIFDNNDVQTNVSVSRMMDNVNNQELTEEFARIGDDEKEEKRRLIVELNEKSNLYVRQGTIHRIVFDVTNNHYQTIGCYFKVRSLPLPVYNVQPTYTWIFAGRTVNVYVDIEVPRGTTQDVINTLTLYVQGSEIIEKSVYLYVEGAIPNVVDDIKPSVEYTFNNNCAGRLGKDRCAKSRWSVDVRVQDSGSGLKSVKSSPNEIYPRTEFVSGTRSPVTFYYSATCCSTEVKITATDLRNNVNTYTIDVTAWDNLSEAEIAAIAVGALFLLLLIIFIVILIIFCVRKRRSHDLPYTQRYGSRPPTRPERTSF